MRHLFFLLSLAGSWAAAGCTPWIVVRQTEPNPLAGQARFSLQPLTFDALVVGDKQQADYLAGKDPEQRASWQADLGAMNQLFAEELLGGAAGIGITPHDPRQPPGTFAIVPRIVFIEPGFYVGLAAASAQVRMVMQIYNGSALVDEIQAEVAVPANLIYPSSGQRLRQGAAQLGAIAAQYLRARTGR